MSVKRRSYRVAIFSAVAAASLAGTMAPILAQDVAPPTKKWRPQEGTYASPGKGFTEACGEFGDLIIGLRNKSVSGREWGCKVNKLTETGPDAIRLDMTCSDYNLAEGLKKPEDTKFKEVVLLKKIDDNSMRVRKTVDGKFTDPEWKAAYCSREAQQMYRDAGVKSEADTEQRKAAQQAAWRPRDDVYARPGDDFDDRCMKSVDAVVQLAKNFLSVNTASCYVAHVTSTPPYTGFARRELQAQRSRQGRRSFNDV